MTVHVPSRRRDPLWGCDADPGARLVRLTGQSACEGRSLPCWFWHEEQIELARICGAITDVYN